MAGAVKGTEMALKARKALEDLNATLETEPALFIDQNGRHWCNGSARAFLDEKDIDADELAEWVKASGGYLRQLLYRRIRMEVTGLPGGVLVLLKATPEASPEPGLTERERQVLLMLVRGLSNKEIARVLKVSPGTVNSHLDNIYRKFGCSGRLHACLMALNSGFASLSKSRA